MDPMYLKFDLMHDYVATLYSIVTEGLTLRMYTVYIDM